MRNKREMYELYEKGFFGNKLQTWSSVTELENSGYSGTVTVRYRGHPPGKFIAYDVPVGNIRGVINSWAQQGADPRLMAFNESAPDELLLIQGEVMRGLFGLELFYSAKKAKMRTALEDGKSSRGLQAKLLLQGHLTPSSYDDVMELLDLFPDHVIEFSAYSKDIGNLPARNTVIWEVRDY